jgi:AcrR family transcriptional regulator
VTVSGKSSARSPGRPRQQGQESGRERLLKIARQEFARKGYAATSVEELVSMADVTSPTLYHHFGNKLGLFTATARDVYDRTLTAFRAAVQEDATFAQAVDAIIDVSASLMRDEPTLAMMISTMQFELRRDPELGVELRDVVIGFRAFFDDLAQRAPLELRPTPESTRDLSHLLVAIVAGIGSEGLLLARPEDIDGMLDSLRRLTRPRS